MLYIKFENIVKIYAIYPYPSIIKTSYSLVLWTSDTFWSSSEANVSCVWGLDPWRLCGEIPSGLGSNASSGAVLCALRGGVLAFGPIGGVEPTCVVESKCGPKVVEWKCGPLAFGPCRAVGPTCGLTEWASPKWPLTEGVELTCLLLFGN